MLTRVANEICKPEVPIIFANGPDEPDTALVLAAKSGDLQAFECLVDRHQRRILAIAMRFTRIREDAEDIVQQSLQKAFVHLHKFEEKSSSSTWLTRIAINEGLMLLRRRRSLREISLDDSSGSAESPELEIHDSAPGPEGSYLEFEQKRILSAAVQRLNPRTRKAIELRELGELSTKETARVLGLSVGAVKARVFHGRRKLQATLKRYVKSTWTRRNQTLRVSRNTNRPSTPTCFEPVRLSHSMKPNDTIQRECPVCGSHFIARSHRRGFFERHILRALRIRPYRCNACDCRFYSRGSTAHLTESHGVRHHAPGAMIHSLLLQGF